MDKLARRDEPALRKISDNLARDLDSAAEGQWVHVDQKGRVRSLARYRALRAVSVAGLGMAAALPIAYGLAFGPVGAIVGLGFTGLVAGRAWPARRLRYAAELIESERLDEADRQLDRVVKSPLAPRQIRATAILDQGVVCVRRGDHEGALAYVRKALPRFVRGKRRPLAGIKADYLEAQLLANLGRVDEARKRVDELGPEPEGEYLRVVYWTVDLYVSLCAGKHNLDADELHERARKGLTMTAGTLLIALAAWAHSAAGDADQAAHLLAEARDRLTPLMEQRMRAGMPALAAWLDDQPVQE